MKRRGLQLNRYHRWSLYATGLVLLVSGIGWEWLHRLDLSGSSSDPLRELKPWLMKAHGFAALGFVLLWGTLLPVHVRFSWHARKNRANGLFFISAVGVLTLSGYSLYYLGDETLRALCSDVHFWLGVVMPLLLIWHIWSGHRATGSKP